MNTKKRKRNNGFIFNLLFIIIFIFNLIFIILFIFNLVYISC